MQAAPGRRERYKRDTRGPPVAQYLILNSRLTQSPLVLLNRIRAHDPRDVTTRLRHFYKRCESHRPNTSGRAPQSRRYALHSDRSPSPRMQMAAAAIAIATVLSITTP